MSMSENRNRQYAAAEGFSRTIPDSSKISVLHILPVEISESEQDDICKDITTDFEFIQYKKSNVLKSFKALNSFISKISFIAQVIEKIRKQTHIHIYYVKGASLLNDILALFIIGKFYSKKIIFEHKNYKDYYLFDDFNRLKKRMFRMADTIIVPSNNLRQSLLKRKFPALFRMPIATENTIEPKVIKDVQPKIFVDAHLEEVFNFHCLAKAFQLVKQKYPRAELVIKGSGSLKGNFIKTTEAEKMHGILFDDSVTFDDIDIFLNCYHIEHFSEKLLKAMGRGIPVISTPIGLIDNLVSGKNILMFQYNDFSTLADHILSLIEEPGLAEKLSTESVNYYKSYCSASQKREKSDKYFQIF
ncbi:MAG: glycosyltransferase [Calditrichaeota bacterium]|nr:MAG: glycosyltransferase [Calditrichota bacterium]